MRIASLFCPGCGLRALVKLAFADAAERTFRQSMKYSQVRATSLNQRNLHYKASTAETAGARYLLASG
jgi:hypothetical protein